MAAISRPIQLQPTQHPAPVCADFEDRESVVAFEKAVRTHRAHAEPFELTPLDGRVDGAWRVSGASGAAYIVDIVDGGGLNDACSCPDFLVGELGVCKHLEAVRRGIRTRAGLHKAFQRLGTAPDRPTLTVAAQGGLSLKALGTWPPRVLKPEWLTGAENGAGLSLDHRLLQPGYLQSSRSESFDFVRKHKKAGWTISPGCCHCSRLLWVDHGIVVCQGLPVN